MLSFVISTVVVVGIMDYRQDGTPEQLQAIVLMGLWSFPLLVTSAACLCVIAIRGDKPDGPPVVHFLDEQTNVTQDRLEANMARDVIAPPGRISEETAAALAEEFRRIPMSSFIGHSPYGPMPSAGEMEFDSTRTAVTFQDWLTRKHLGYAWAQIYTLPWCRPVDTYMLDERTKYVLSIIDGMDDDEVISLWNFLIDSRSPEANGASGWVFVIQDKLLPMELLYEDIRSLEFNHASMRGLLKLLNSDTHLVGWRSLPMVFTSRKALFVLTRGTEGWVKLASTIVAVLRDPCLWVTENHRAFRTLMLARLKINFDAFVRFVT